ncbi:MAG TPA: ATP-binding protein [Desulfobacter sp.]|nr:ATP-binding protein [Desulfobacter sp.]
MKKLPIGISTFSEIINGNAYYVDKSQYVQHLCDSGKYYFLSRPRRFGKSLFVDTLKCAFEGEKDLFKGLYLEKNWDWDKICPVISISFGRGMVEDKAELNHRILRLLSEQAEYHGITCGQTLVADRFAELIRKLWTKSGKQVVILVDEYDKPILDHIENPAKAQEMQDGLKNFYSVIKDSDRYIRFCFITGVSKFSRVSIFSDLNNLEDISLQPEMGALCGYTEKELTQTFHERLDGIDIDTLREWYNGYSFLGEERVYNPFDVLLFLKNNQYGSYWFESATPTFLIKLLKQHRFYLPHLDGIDVNESVISSYSIDQLTAETVLFQSGYLTIDTVMQVGPRRVFRLKFPNQEVKLSFTDAILVGYAPGIQVMAGFQNNLYHALESQDLESVQRIFKSFFSSIPYEWYTAGNVDRYEGYYASVVYAFLASLGFDLHPEESASHGRADLVLKTDQTVYVMEFKVVEILGDGKKAIDQIREKGYHDSYVQAGKNVILVGIDFSRKERNIVGFAFETV